MWLPFFHRRRPPSITMTTTVPRHIWTRDRLHLNATPYVLPNDVEDSNRLDFQHFMLKHILDGNFWAPLQYPHRILDVGGGTGRWAIEMAQQFPGARVYSLDISPPLTLGSSRYGLSGAPPNCEFVQGDMFDGIDFDDNTFDFVHMRMLFSAVPINEWPPLVREVVRVTRPGGWIESVEGSSFRFFRNKKATATKRLLSFVVNMCHDRNIDPTYGEHIDGLLHSAGLDHIYKRSCSCLAGPLAGRLGIMVGKDSVSAFEGMGSMLVHQGKLKPAELDELIVQMREEINIGAVSWPIFQVIGQKPIQYI